MTVLSQVNAEKFSKTVKTVFPENRIFDPIDYLAVFNGRRDIPLGENTFRKYLSIICDSIYFPGLSRVRDNSAAPYRYFVDNGVGEVVIKSPSSGAEASSKVKLSSISDESLINFTRKIEPLMMSGRWYLPSTLGRKYNSRYKKHLRPGTLKEYMSQAFRRGLWDGLERRSGRRNAHSYRSVSISIKKKDTTLLDVPQETGAAPSRKKTVWSHSVQCSNCKGENPEVARFCMLCGEGLRISLKVVVQESVFTVPVNMAGLTSPDDLISLVRGHISCHAEVVVVDGEGGTGEKVYAVTVKE